MNKKKLIRIALLVVLLISVTSITSFAIPVGGTYNLQYHAGVPGYAYRTGWTICTQLCSHISIYGELKWGSNVFGTDYRANASNYESGELYANGWSIYPKVGLERAQMDNRWYPISCVLFC